MTQASNAELELAEPIDIARSCGLPSDPWADAVLDHLRRFWRERRFVYQVTALGLALTTLTAFLLPKQYESTTRLMPPDNQSSSSLAMQAALSSKAGSGLGSVAGSLLGLQTSGELFVGILASRTVGEQLVNRLDLKKVYRVRLQEDARKRLSGNSSISQDRKSGIITITVTDRDPARAAAIAAAYVQELNRLTAELSTSGAHRERIFLEDRIKTVQTDLEAAEQEFSRFSSQNMAIDIKEQGKSMVEAAATLQGQLIAGESEEQGLRQIYTGNNVRVRSLAARNQELRKDMEKIGGTGQDPSSPPSASLSSASSAEPAYPSIKMLPLLGVTYADLYRRSKVQEAVYEALTQQLEMAKVEEVRELPSVKILDPAEVPERKSSPPRLFLMLLGTLFSFVFAAAWIFGSAYWREMSVENPGKQIVSTVLRGGRAHLLHMSENGSRLGWVLRRARGLRPSIGN
jgi:uncharacterized protein involved in exopolysaccharide biosynthesis